MPRSNVLRLHLAYPARIPHKLGRKAEPQVEHYLLNGTGTPVQETTRRRTQKTTGARGVRDPVVAFSELNLAGGHDGGSDLLLTGEDARHPDAVVLVGNAQALLSSLGLALEQDLRAPPP